MTAQNLKIAFKSINTFHSSRKSPSLSKWQYLMKNPFDCPIYLFTTARSIISIFEPSIKKLSQNYEIA